MSTDQSPSRNCFRRPDVVERIGSHLGTSFPLFHGRGTHSWGTFRCQLQWFCDDFYIIKDAMHTLHCLSGQKSLLSSTDVCPVSLLTARCWLRLAELRPVSRCGAARVLAIPSPQFVTSQHTAHHPSRFAQNSQQSSWRRADQIFGTRRC